jgi:SagB-type dehydrogenase family enzyme
LVITACFERQQIKYKERAYRFAVLEIGHLAQNILLTAAALGLAALPIGGFVDREINGYLAVDGLSEAALYVILIGRPL